MQRDLLMKRLGVPGRGGADGEEDRVPSKGAPYQPRGENTRAGLLVSPAVPFGDFFDGQADLGAEISACVHDPEGASSQNHPLSVLIVLIIVLQRATAAEMSISATERISFPVIPYRFPRLVGQRRTYEARQGLE